MVLIFRQCDMPSWRGFRIVLWKLGHSLHPRKHVTFRV